MLSNGGKFHFFNIRFSRSLGEERCLCNPSPWYNKSLFMIHISPLAQRVSQNNVKLHLRANTF